MTTNRRNFLKAIGAALVALPLARTVAAALAEPAPTFPLIRTDIEPLLHQAYLREFAEPVLYEVSLVPTAPPGAGIKRTPLERIRFHGVGEEWFAGNGHYATEKDLRGIAEGEHGFQQSVAGVWGGRFEYDEAERVLYVWAPPGTVLG